MEDLVRIVVAEDDEDDRILVEEAFAQIGVKNPVTYVGDGEALLDCLRGEGDFAESPPQPSLVLLDLNMPRMDGRTALQHIKKDAELRHTPVVVLTTSSADVEVMTTYQLGAASFMTKPVTCDKLVEALRHFSEYWLRTVRLPD